MNATRDKIQPPDDLVKLVVNWKNAGHKIVFTNGCFDIIHVGHVDYLEKARLMGDKLVVAINSDESVKKLKGKGRPVSKENDRARILAGMEFVDAVTIFDQDTPIEVIKAVNPDILVKGSDYLAENIVGADVVMASGGEVRTINLVKDYSTSGIIDKIKKLN